MFPAVLLGCSTTRGSGRRRVLIHATALVKKHQLVPLSQAPGSPPPQEGCPEFMGCSFSGHILIKESIRNETSHIRA